MLYTGQWHRNRAWRLNPSWCATFISAAMFLYQVEPVLEGSLARLATAVHCIVEETVRSCCHEKNAAATIDTLYADLIDTRALVGRSVANPAAADSKRNTRPSSNVSACLAKRVLDRLNIQPNVNYRSVLPVCCAHSQSTSSTTSEINYIAEGEDATPRMYWLS